MSKLLPSLIVLALIIVTHGGVAHADSKEERARDLYGQANAAFGLGRYQKAATLYESAFEAWPDSTLLYNAAQANRLAGNKERALELYRNYVRLYRREGLLPQVRRQIEELQEQIDQERRAPAAPQQAKVAEPGAAAADAAQQPAVDPAGVDRASPGAPQATTAAGQPGSQPASAAQSTAAAPPVATGADRDTHHKGSRALFWASMAATAAGGIAIATGVVMGLRAESLSDQVSQDAREGRFDRDKVNDGQRAETLQWVAYGVGAAALIGGAVLYYLGRSRPGQTRAATLVPSVDANHVGGSFHLVF